MGKKILLFIMFLTLTLSLSSCSLLAKKITYEQFSNYLSTENYFNYLPNSFKDQKVIASIENTKYVNIADLPQKIGGLLSDDNSSGQPPAELTKAQLTGFNLANMNHFTGIAMVFNPNNLNTAKVGSAYYIAEFVNDLNQILAKTSGFSVGDSNLTINGGSISFSGSKNPIALGNVYVTSKMDENNMVITFHTTYDDNSDNNYYTNDVTFDVFVKVTMSLVKDKIHSEIDLYVNAVENQTDNMDQSTVNATVNFGTSIVAVQDSSLIINYKLYEKTTDSTTSANNTESTYNDSFVLNKGKTTSIQYTIKSAEATADNITLSASGNDTEGHINLSVITQNSELLGNNVPAEAVKGVVDYDKDNNIIFTGGTADINTQTCNYGYNSSTGNDECTYETANQKYSGYSVDMRVLNGWDSIKESTLAGKEGRYDVYNGSDVVFSVNDYIDQESDPFVEAKGVGAIGTSAMFEHLVGSDTMPSLDIPFTSDYMTSFQNLYSHINDPISSPDMTQAQYQVPVLNKADFYIP